MTIQFSGLFLLLLSTTTLSTCMSLSTKPTILCVGVAGIDFVATVPEFPEPDDKIRSTSLLVEGGGNAANTACSMGRMSPEYVQEVTLVTAVGDDPNGDTILAGLQQNHVNTEFIERYSGTSPFTYVIACNDEEHGNSRTCIHQPSTQDMTEDWVKDFDVSKYTAAHFDIRHPKAAVALAEKCLKANVPYSVDVERPRDGLKELVEHASIVDCSAAFCDAILGPSETHKRRDQDIVARLRSVMDKMAPNAAIAVTTLGGLGSCLVRLKGDHDDEKGETTILDNDGDPNVPVVTSHDGALWCTAWGDCKVVDSTGAGDSFQGGFLAALWAFAAANGRTKAFEGGVPMDSAVLGHALRIGTRVAAKKLGAAGARQGLPYAAKDKWLQSEFDAILAKTARKAKV